MDKIEPGSFVRYHPEGRREDHHPALVLGILGTEKKIFLICVLHERVARQATVEECTPVDAHTIRGGTIGFLGHNELFGLGEVVDEKIVDNLLYVKLGEEDDQSDFIPLINVTLSCPCNTCA